MSEDIPDGNSETILLVERCDSGIHWMEPRDMTLDEALDGLANAGREGICSGHGGARAHVVFVDGSVEMLNLSRMGAFRLRSLLTRSGDEPIDAEALPFADLQVARRESAQRLRKQTPFVRATSLAVFVASGVLLLWTTRRKPDDVPVPGSSLPAAGGSDPTTPPAASEEADNP